MFLLSRRQVHAGLAGAGATLAYLAAAEVGSRKPVRVGGLVVLSSMALAGLMSSKSSVKARNTEARLNNFFNNGGSVGGNFQVNGNHVVTGTVSAGGTISNSSGNINTNGNVNAPSGNVSAGTLTSSGDVQATSGTVHAAGLISSGSVQGASTTGVSIQGSVTPDAFGGGFGGGSGLNATAQADLNALASAHNDLVTDVQACVNRVNDFISALG